MIDPGVARPRNFGSGAASCAGWRRVDSRSTGFAEAGAISGWRARDRLKDCISSKSLWPEGGETARTAVLAELPRSDFEPTITTIGRIDCLADRCGQDGCHGTDRRNLGRMSRGWVSDRVSRLSQPQGQEQ